jgi:UDP-glucose 4-epimerase
MRLIKSDEILLTGANGLVGSFLLPKLIFNSYKVRVLGRKLNQSSAKEVKVFNIDSLSADRIYKDALTDVNVVIHLAALVNVMKHPSCNALEEYKKINFYGTMNLAHQAASAGVKRFIFISTIKVNGEVTRDGKKFYADDIPCPQDPYSQSKYEAEQALLRLSKVSGMEIVIIRPPLIYGPGVKANFFSIMKWLNRNFSMPLGGINNKRSFVGVANLTDLIVTCINHPRAANQIFLVSDDYDVSTTFLLQSISFALGKKSNLIPVPVFFLKIFFFAIGKPNFSKRLLESLQIDITKTKQRLNWKPPVIFQDGIEETVRHFLVN